ncbi:hypothetical protein ACIQUB_06075 [Rhizobium sp. NPDC090275]|uniref:hypothetical protein n=1 Tax=Rhizobium sp. NPDC090275 TaxID=3364498 RepID=UPI00383B7212
MTKTPIPCTIIDDSFSRSGCKLVLTDAGGELPQGVSRSGIPISRTFSPSAVAVVDANFDCVLAPVDLVAAEHFARRILDGDPRARTEGGRDILLASAFLALLLVGGEVTPDGGAQFADVA